MILGIGVDVVDIARFGKVLGRTPGVVDRLFTPVEKDAPIHSLAACFAAKEAVAKALGAPPGLRWEDVEVRHGRSGRPWLETRGTVADAAGKLGVRHWHLSLTHDGGVSVAMVVAEG